MRAGQNQVQRNQSTQPGAPVLDRGRYVFRLGELELEVDPELGGRITRFSLAGQNVLTGPEVVAGGEGSTPNMWGSTFWTSPQSAWGWPPEVAIDAAPYRARLESGVLELESDPGMVTGFAVRKRFWTQAAPRRACVEYSLENRGASSPAAPWEISRVPKRGLVLFAATAPALPHSNLPSTFAGGVAWVDVARAPGTDSKLFQDGSEGWLAYVDRDLCLLKTFEDTRPDEAAPDEAEIEVFVSGLHDYVEVEQQGRYALPPAGGRSSWRVTWQLERVPASVDARLGSHELVAWIRSLVTGAR